MARVTIEDCVDKVDNRFELVLIAARRAKNVHSGMPITVDRDNDKNPVIALREIALGHILVKDLKEELIKSLQTRNRIDQIDEDEASVVDSDDTDDRFDYIPSGVEFHISDDHSDLDDSCGYTIENVEDTED